MKSKTLIILIVICCLLAGAAYMMLNKGSVEPYDEMGESLFPGLPVNDIAGITIQGTEGNVNLKKGETVWVVENKFNYPADFAKITELAKKIKDTKIERSFKAEKDTISRLGLNVPDKADTPADEKGTRIILENKDKKVLQDIIFGKTKESASGTGGNYLMLAKESAIYVVDNNFKYLDKNPSEWINKDLFSVNAGDVERVICVDPKSDKPVFTMKRPEKNKEPEFADLPQGKKIKTSKVNSLFGAISSFQIEDVADPAKDTKTMGFDGKYLEFHLFDGTVYKVFPGSSVENDDTKHYMKAEAAYIKPEVKEPEKKAETDAGKGDKKAEAAAPAKPDEKQKSPDELAADAKKLSTWVYVISKWRYDNFVTDSVQLFEEEKKEEPKAQNTEQPEETDININPEALEGDEEEVAEEPSSTEAEDVKTEKAEQPSAVEEKVEAEVKPEESPSKAPEPKIEEPHP